MANANGGGLNRKDFQPPPSSILASHLANGTGRSKLSRDGFAQLLDEALSNDEDGKSNISSDVAINTKLIVVVAQVGIQPVLDDNNDDPFRAKADQGRGGAQLKSCLDVLHMVILRSPTVVYQPLNQDDSSSDDPLPIFAWLTPILVCLSLRSKNSSIVTLCSTILQTFLKQDDICLCQTCGTVATYLQSCSIGTY